MEIVLETERLYLRKFTADDAALIYELNSNPKVVKYLHEPATTQEIAAIVMETIILPQYSLYGHGRWAVHLKDTNEFMGWCGLKYVKERNEIDLGYRYKQEHWGKGYGFEAAKATLDYGLNTLNMPRIIAMHHVDNIGSQKIIEKLGFTFLNEDFIDGCPVKYYETLHNNS